MGAVVRTLGILDLWCALTIIVHPWLPGILLLYSAAYLIFKGGYFAFMYNIASIIDVFFGLYLIILAYDMSAKLISIVGIIYLGQKGLISLF